MSDRCNVCGGMTALRFPKVTDYITNETFSIRQCEQCGLNTTVPCPVDMSRYYGKAYYGNRHGLTSRYCVRRRLKFIGPATCQNTKPSLLDVGCGDGSFLLAAQRKGWETFGVDIQPDSAKEAGLDVYSDVNQVSEKAPFDCITMWHSLEHMTDPKGMVSQLAKMLKPNGRLVVAVPDNGSFQAKLFKHHWIPLDVPRHIYGFNSRSLGLCLENAGLFVCRKWHTEVEYDLMGWSQSTLNIIFSEPNVFLDQLSGKRRCDRRLTSLLNMALGFVLTALALPLVFAEVCFRRGGTLVIKAGQKPADCSVEQSEGFCS